MKELHSTGVGAVFPFADENAWHVVIRVIEETAGIRPVGRRDTKGVKRALYAPAMNRTILNVSAARILERLGYPMAAMTLEVDYPLVAAHTAADLFLDAGFAARILDSADIELGIPRGFMYFVLAEKIVPILFWPRDPDPALLAQIPGVQPWEDPPEG
ncbi:hypothetical protein HY091_00410 [Candidatus Kaiserbacteria bacterium]|nr:hypothetical protein [Candidatus Kaiserbacteria bacterium]